MRLISMHKATRDMEAGAPPSPAVIEAMGPLMGEMMQAGIFETGEGLRPSSHGVRVTFRGGQRTVTPGPFTGTNEAYDRYLIVRVPSIDDAIDWAARFAGDRDAEVDVRPVTEAWDLGFMPRPADVTTTRYMILGASGVADGGTVLASETFQPGGVRLRFRGGDVTVLDGPFTESKELIAGFSIMNVASYEEAIPWATRFASLFDELEIDIRTLA
jgi:hypothetical protein